ncbi:MAG: hypothetical protein ACE3JQ_04320 [Paenisporosarcina sp.]
MTLLFLYNLVHLQASGHRSEKVDIEPVELDIERAKVDIESTELDIEPP